MIQTKYHQPVLINEVAEFFDPKKGKIFIDATLGHGGHAIKLLSNQATVYGIEIDQAALSAAQDRINSQKYSAKFFSFHNNYNQIEKIYRQHINKPVSGILFDLGLNLWQQTGSRSGFSFNDPHSLDMRLDQKIGVSALEFINTASHQQLFQVVSKLGQQPQADRLCRYIVSNRKVTPITTSLQLSELIKTFYFQNHLQSKNHPATKFFLSLKIYLNHELENLRQGIFQSLSISSPNTKIAIITFHSTEDRAVKLTFKNLEKQFSFITHRPIRPGFNEIKTNRLARSAILRSYTIT